MKDLNTVKEFVTSPFGVFLLSIIGSIIATVLCKVISKGYINSKSKHIAKYYIMGYSRGAMAETAKSDSFKQVVLVGELLMNAIIEMCWMLGTLLTTIILMLLFKNERMIISISIVLCSIIVAIHAYRFRIYYRTLSDKLLNHIFGEEYLEGVFKNALNSFKKRKNI